MAIISPERFTALRKQSGRTQEQMGDLLGVSGKYVGMIERGEKTIEEQSSLGLLFRGFEASARSEELREPSVLREDPPLYRVALKGGGGRKAGAEEEAAITEEHSVRYGPGTGYGSTMNSLSADSASLATHLVMSMQREEVFQLLRDLTQAGEAGDDAALRKARALLEILPKTHPTTAAAGG